MNRYLYDIKSDLIELVTGNYLPEDRRKFMSRITDKLDKFEGDEKAKDKRIAVLERALDLACREIAPMNLKGFTGTNNKPEMENFFIQQAEQENTNEN